ncbi:MAG: hypothetical protein M1831_004014 [Alyxoria varia]|nr:MAG: hypothetical protein M1831_004014 [Alyxoria varia]
MLRLTSYHHPSLTNLARNLLHHGPKNQRHANRRVRLFFPDPSDNSQDDRIRGSSCIADTCSARHVWESDKYPFFYMPWNAFVNPAPGHNTTDSTASAAGHPAGSGEQPRQGKSDMFVEDADNMLEAKAAAYAAGAKDVSRVMSGPAPDPDAVEAAAVMSAAVKSAAARASSAVADGNHLKWQALDQVEGIDRDVGATVWSVSLEVGTEASPSVTTNRVVSFEEGPLRGLVRWEFSAGKWFEEDTPISIHPKDPFKRIDLLHSTRSITVTIPRPRQVPFPFPGSTPDALLTTFKGSTSLSATSEAIGAASNRASLARAAEALESTSTALPPSFPPSIDLKENLPLAHTSWSVHLLETLLPARYYMPLTSILPFQQGSAGSVWSLRRSKNKDGSFVMSGCPYKGTAEYYDVVIRGPSVEGGAGGDGNSGTAKGLPERHDNDDDEDDGFEKVPSHSTTTAAAEERAAPRGGTRQDRKTGNVTSNTKKAVRLAEGPSGSGGTPHSQSKSQRSRSTFLASPPPPHTSSARAGGDEDELVLRELIWYYTHPNTEVAGIAGLCCFYGEKVDVWVDGVRVGSS